MSSRACRHSPPSCAAADVASRHLGCLGRTWSSWVVNGAGGRGDLVTHLLHLTPTTSQLHPPSPSLPLQRDRNTHSIMRQHVVGDDTFPSDDTFLSQAPSCGQLSDTGREFLTPQTERERGKTGDKDPHLPACVRALMEA